MMPYQHDDAHAVDPRACGVAAAARRGNAEAIRVAADWLRDHNEGEDAATLDILACEFEARRGQARQLRLVLASPHHVEYTPASRPSLKAVRAYLESDGLPVGCYKVDQTGGAPFHFVLLIPTDGSAVAETATQLLAQLADVFPGVSFVPWVENRALTSLGRDAEDTLDRVDGRMQGREDAA